MCDVLVIEVTRKVVPLIKMASKLSLKTKSSSLDFWVRI